MQILIYLEKSTAVFAFVIHTNSYCLLIKVLKYIIETSVWRNTCSVILPECICSPVRDTRKLQCCIGNQLNGVFNVRVHRSIDAIRPSWYFYEKVPFML